MPAKTIELARKDHIVVEMKYGMDYQEFAEKHLFANYPVVIGDACAAWPAKGKFTPQFFKEKYSTREVQIKGKSYKLGEVIDWIMNATKENPAPYPCTIQINQECPELIADVTPRSAQIRTTRPYPQ
ncbi:hypothetical protein ACFSUS_17880 [Spirosoma soli]|uniref:Uncharacterized protein n=1 Tax=Spirosoma soli TaxID=1770529 RepID=A0ABW5M6B4_9BACT